MYLSESRDKLPALRTLLLVIFALLNLKVLPLAWHVCTPFSSFLLGKLHYHARASI